METRKSARGNAANAIRQEDLPIHNWYTFPLGYPPHLPREYLQRFDFQPGALIVDPFTGTGTTLIEGRRLGYRVIGVDAHPMTHFAASTKVNWEVDPEVMLEHSIELAERVNRKLVSQGLPSPAGIVFPATAEDLAPDRRLRGLTAEARAILPADWISPLPLHRALILAELLKAEARPWTGHQLLALARVLPTGVGNVRFGPEPGAGKLKADAPVVEMWLERCRAMAEDLRQIRGHGCLPPAEVHLGDARDVLPLPDRAVDGIITSPPYANEKNYGRFFRLESLVLGLLDGRESLRTVNRRMVRSNSRGIYRDDTDDRLAADLPEVVRIAKLIEERRIELGKTSGFERAYPKVVLSYFGGMRRHFEQVARVLKPGAPCAYVVGDQASFLGVMIRTAHLLAEVAETAGFDLEGIDLFRERYATRSRQWLREEVLLLRRRWS